MRLFKAFFSRQRGITLGTDLKKRQKTDFSSIKINYAMSLIVNISEKKTTKPNYLQYK